MFPFRRKKSDRLDYQLFLLLEFLAERSIAKSIYMLSMPDKDHNCYGSKKKEILIENNNMEQILKRIRKGKPEKEIPQAQRVALSRVVLDSVRAL